MKHQTSAFTFVALGVILGLFWGGGCGGSGGGSGANAAQQGAVYNRIHTSTVGGPIVIDTSIAGMEIREITFTPNGPSDSVNQILFDGTYDKVGTEPGSIGVELFDENDNQIGGTYFVSLGAAGTGIQYRLGFTPFYATAGLNWVYPSTSFKLRIFTTGTQWNTSTGQINSTRIRIITTENVTVESPSSRMSG